MGVSSIGSVIASFGSSLFCSFLDAPCGGSKIAESQYLIGPLLLKSHFGVYFLHVLWALLQLLAILLKRYFGEYLLDVLYILLQLLEILGSQQNRLFSFVWIVCLETPNFIFSKDCFNICFSNCHAKTHFTSYVRSQTSSITLFFIIIIIKALS